MSGQVITPRKLIHYGSFPRTRLLRRSARTPIPRLQVVKGEPPLEIVELADRKQTQVFWIALFRGSGQCNFGVTPAEG
jgi:hypothetical protein